MDAIAIFHQDFPTLVVAIAICTAGLALFAFSLLGRRISNIDLSLAGAFAMTYGFRLIMRTQAIALLAGNPAWLPYLSSAMQYVVPVPAAVLFERFFGERLRWLNRIAAVAFIAVALIAIPTEIVRREPFAFSAIEDVIVTCSMILYFANIILFAPGDSKDRRILRAGTAVFGVYVLNEHFRFTHLPFGVSSEAFGFLIFIGTVVATLVRHAIRTQVRVAEVDGELAAARQIQMSILPKTPPKIRGLDLSAVYAPASEVAGDFYDFLPLGEDGVGILIADVSGHGVPAALVASMLKAALASHVELANEPARLLHGLNRFFCGKLERQFITASYLSIDAATGALKIASAGHPPPVIVRADRSIEELTADGVLLGRFAGARYCQSSALLRAGDAVVLYTDGVTEALNAKGEMWGEARFHESLAAGASVQQVLGALNSWSRTLQDDVTLVVAKCVQS